jgi:hypothetical protein
MMPPGSPRIVFLGTPPEFNFREPSPRRRESAPYRRDLRRIKRGSLHGVSLKAHMHRLAMNGDTTAKQWFENKRRTG